MLAVLIGGVVMAAVAAGWFFAATCDENLPFEALVLLFGVGVALAATAAARSGATAVRAGGPVAVLAGAAAVAGLAMLRTFDCIG